MRTSHPRGTTTQRDKDRAAIARGRPACHICGRAIDYDADWLDPLAYVVDHLVPLNRGGPDTLANKAAAHRSCNRAKSDKHHAPIVRRSGSLD